MSCWREQTVLRLPAKAIGIHTMEEWYRFEREYEDRMDWEEGCFAPSLCTYEHGPFLDYILKDRAPVQGNGCDYDARPLTPAERKEAALFEAERMALLQVPRGAKIIMIDRYTLEKGGKLYGICAVTTEENIGYTKEIS